MAHQQKNQHQQKKQVSSDMPESKHRSFKNKNLLQDKKDGRLEEELDHKPNFGNGPKKLGKRS